MVDYTYDGNGNMISDQNKKIIGISYNVLNLPGGITVAGKGAIKYYFDVSGNKLQKRKDLKGDLLRESEQLINIQKKRAVHWEEVNVDPV
ncbi:hypothetical protein [Arachidicoccus terrestris]|uniref:hypothetical protein n=1 Tax=Arachidicoccus terrestris TaxID=2875539 RepID=UPI001CC3EB69|nr:hypothetical protein [Arachidicoccus terrestris]UAY54269.1 hypothetical protein K9M52_12485 [Arachidicoccus terrestris]